MFILLLIFGLSVGYTAMNKQIFIEGNLTYRAESDIRIENISVSNSSNSDVKLYTPSFSVSTVELGSNLPNLNSTITYDISISNNSNTYKTISGIDSLNDNNSNIIYTFNEDIINYKLLPNEVKIFQVTVSYDDSVQTLPSLNTENLKLNLNFDDYLFKVIFDSNGRDGIFIIRNSSQKCINIIFTIKTKTIIEQVVCSTDKVKKLGYDSEGNCLDKSCSTANNKVFGDIGKWSDTSGYLKFKGWSYSSSAKTADIIESERYWEITETWFDEQYENDDHTINLYGVW